jgi:hypothetical protein
MESSFQVCVIIGYHAHTVIHIYRRIHLPNLILFD